MLVAGSVLVFLVGLLAGVNPYTAPVLAVRATGAARARDVALAVAAAAAVALAVGLVAWEAARLVSWVLTYGVPVAGALTLLGAWHAWRPFRRGGAPAPVPAGAPRWVLRYAGDVAYYAGAAWVGALAIALRQVTPGAFALPVAAAWAGVGTGTLVWGLALTRRLPTDAPAPDHAPGPAMRALAAAYAGAGLILIGMFVVLAA